MRASRHEGLELKVPQPVPEDWRNRLLAHLMRLSPESRRNRFFVWMSDEALARHAARTDPAAVVEARVDGMTRGMAEVHLLHGPRAAAEISVSVEDGWQRRGIGAALVHRAIREARRRGAEEITLFLLPGNAAMRKIAFRACFVRAPYGDGTLFEARLLLPSVAVRRARFHWPAGLDLGRARA